VGRSPKCDCASKIYFFACHIHSGKVYVTLTIFRKMFGEEKTNLAKLEIKRLRGNDRLG
jgi:hypothetical protein